MNTAIKETHFQFPGQVGFYKGKVRDVYFFEDKIAVVASDRISAFDVVLPKPIPYKGQVLNQIAAKFLQATADIVPNWVTATPDPNVTIGKKCEPFKVEMVIRGYLAGHAAREYLAGKRSVCGVSLPEGLKENDKLPEPIITPTTKADFGHDEDISREDILAKGIVSEADYAVLEKYTQALFAKGTEMAREKGLILVDTKYEFGKFGEEILLIDEIHTPDSSRYFYADGYEAHQAAGLPQKQLSKEFVRQWLIANGFQGKEGQLVPEMPNEFVQEISGRYIELYEQIIGEPFVKGDISQLEQRIEKAVLKELGA
ncbi:phosphoribosylaminoimidazole-succinocarboxamide synthase [Rhodonellum psychrophilum GCM71 = DSM 17998]|uniref:Phosphoribosylaminoimidazole-succinocarboxamide synthase n=2 Tax=Rhodonellum TaxID=336827 RepID=U5C0A6_9BACT|nr:MULTISPECIES: phosphoribosylaminoimidazolesuccinocarboxamide synthase [Rhodonellum]ERM81607.1 phosphoribosylaminoimidazole-succinocarboxamide synthase [Rhodonellum psychrophilum GCM71 = DSM 17998]SDZ33634.1 phosphoribosylaminoimidazole-succinocarboxamide synthase [Rhodonellum ikkaensis]